MEHKTCNDNVGCTPNIDCLFTEWQDWTACSSQCEGIMHRDRKVRIHGQGEGQFCAGAVEQTWPCEIESGVLDFTEQSMYLDLSRLITNNLGNTGPGTASMTGQEMPPVLSFSQVASLPETGTSVDLVVRPTSGYMPCEVQTNGVQGHTFAAINVPSGSRVSVEFQLVDSKTGALVNAKELVIKVFDLDGGAAGSSLERLHAKGFTDYFVTSDSSIKVSKELSDLTQFSASVYGTDDDNPLDPTETMSTQERKAVSFLYKESSSAEMSLEVTDGAFCKTFLFAIRACFGGNCKANPCKEKEHQAVDCQLSEWRGWGECDTSCGIGQKIRSREVILEPAFGGKPCNDALSETIACSLRPCQEDCQPIDCSWEDWGNWGSCDKCGGEMRRFRHIATHPNCGGRRCLSGAAEEITNCTRTCHGGTLCTWLVWGEWGECSATCDKGLRSRDRYLKAVSAATILAEAHSTQEMHKLDYERKYESLDSRTRYLQSNRIQVLLMSFTGGCMTLFAAVAAIRSCALSPARRSARSRAAAPMELFRSHGYMAAPSDTTVTGAEYRGVSVA